MKKEEKIQLTIETPAIGNVVMEIPYSPSADEKSEDDFIIDIPNRIFVGTTNTHLDLSYVVKNDIEHFKKLNSYSDENHQVHIDTLCIYGIRISGNYIRIEYWFDQFRDNTCHRTCAGTMSHHRAERSDTHFGQTIKVFPDGYSTDVCVYW